MIVITGPMRTGSSYLAEILQSLGVPMGESMSFPLLGGYQEYENPELTSAIIEAVKSGNPVSVKFFLYHIKARQEHYNMLKRMYRPDVIQNDWGIKCPGIFLYSKNLENAARQAGETVRWVYSYRAEEQAREAIAAHAWGHFNEVVYKDFMQSVDLFQGKIYKAMNKLENLIVFDKDDVENDPGRAAVDLCEILGLEQRWEASAREEDREGVPIDVEILDATLPEIAQESV